MNNFKFQNLGLPTADDLNTGQTLKADGIKNRVTDARSWGILRSNAFPAILNIPVSGTNPAPNQLQAFGEFTVNFDTNTGLLSIGSGSNSSLNPQIVGGVAYDLNGERAYIPNDLAFDFSNDIPQGKKSSGNLNIPLTTSGTTGGSGTNPSVLGTYYLWLEYLETTDPLFQELDRNGVIYYPNKTDGYKILITATPVAPNGDGVSIFLCKAVWAVSYPEIITVTDGEVIRTNGNELSTIPTAVVGEPKRVYSLIRDNQVEAILDTNNPTPVYASGQRATVGDHVRAFGSTTPTPKNPHGQVITDFPGGGQEPVAIDNQNNSLAKGIVDLTLDVNGNYVVPQNSPIVQSTALAQSLGSGTLTPASLDATAILNSGITSSVKDAWIRIKQLTATQLVYLSGEKLTQVYPTLAQTSDHTGDLHSTDGWVGFSSSGIVDPAGMYRIFGSIASLGGTDVLLLRKEVVTFPALSPVTEVGFFPIALVYWDGNNLWSDPNLVPGSGPSDTRSAGLVGPRQISTEAKSNSDTGILSQQVPQNLVVNSNYSQNTAGVPSNVTFAGLGASSIIGTGAGTPTSITNATDPKLASQVGSVSGLEFTSNAAQTGTSRIFNPIKSLKPNKYYSISFYYRADTLFNASLKMDISDGAAVSYLTTASGAPVNVLVKNDNNFHRFSVIVQTLDSVDPSTVTPFLQFRFDNGGNALVAAQFCITNVQVTEGEWTTGYSNGSDIGAGSFVKLTGTALGISPNGAYTLFAGAQGNFTVPAGASRAKITAMFYTGIQILDTTANHTLATNDLILKVDGASQATSHFEYQNQSGGGGSNMQTSDSDTIMAIVDLTPGAHILQIQVTAAGGAGGGGREVYAGVPTAIIEFS